MRVQYVACPVKTWEFAFARPRPQLRRAVSMYRGFRLDLPHPVRWQGFPKTEVGLVLGLDARAQLVTPASADGPARTVFPSFVSGQNIKGRITENGGSAYGVEVVLTPWAAFTAFGVDMHELVGRVVEPVALLGEGGHRLTDALASLPDWERRFHLLDDLLAQWIGRGHAWSPQVEQAYAELRRTGGTVPIRKLADAVNWRQRQLEYRFREQIGLSPKETARVFRLRRAVRLLAAGSRPAHIATACGFSDQAHLTREFKAMTNFTPTSLQTAVRNDADTTAAGARHFGMVALAP